MSLALSGGTGGSSASAFTAHVKRQLADKPLARPDCESIVYASSYHAMADIADFPLIWRWTSHTHAMFSASELAALRPCSLIEAARIHDESRAFDQRDSLEPQHFQSIREHSADVSTGEGCAWLRAQAPDLSEQVTVSWDREIALLAPWEFFTARWDDFCYPSSDDVLIIPDRRWWVLRYHHSEIFYFGHRTA